MGSTSFIGTSPSVLEVSRLVGVVADRDTPVFIHGESGTGKELVARLIHERSYRRDGPFIAINAAAIPRDLMESEFFGNEKGSFTGAIGRRQGCFELAHKGVLFLDEIAEMAVTLQAKLLRTLENGRIRRLGGQEEIELDVRVLVATNSDPQGAIEENRLHADLYYRLSVFSYRYHLSGNGGRTFLSSDSFSSTNSTKSTIPGSSGSEIKPWSCYGNIRGPAT